MTTASLDFPFVAFRSELQMNDYSAPDMKCGDLTKEQLIHDFGLSFVSFHVNPFNNEEGFIKGKSKIISDEEVVIILFNEFRFWARVLSFGRYSSLMQSLISNFQDNKGTPFSDPLLDKAFKELILNERSENGSISRIKSVFDNCIDWERGVFPSENKEYLIEALKSAIYPEFTRVQDTFNGIGLAVHNINSMNIEINSCNIYDDHYCASVHYQGQDHFGLDDGDIIDIRFHYFSIFRIWFVLQRWNRYAFRPFMTNMRANIEISGVRPANK
ncbi:DUF3289 family protein [Xylella fastidiosa]|uniref:DUF3289 family protein n=1 Tax=Xylella fastidiosa TaxID=2371 RepID=UPI0007339692|nr:DUF3289 family protein [Xylella fastidiosa]TNW22601.1 DUF3289 family protein [Xylella fastidiosa subsp. pauca]